MKNNRQRLILDIIENEPIETQEQLIERLREEGVTSTQATISRDIKQLCLIKSPSGSGYRYMAPAPQTRFNFAERLRSILRESIISVDHAQNIVVLKTMPGLAGAANTAIEGVEDPRLVGCIAGDDTLMIVARDARSAEDLHRQIDAMRK